MAVGGKPVRPQHLTLRGNEFSFALPDARGIARFSGRVQGSAIEGTVELPSGRGAQAWTAVLRRLQSHYRVAFCSGPGNYGWLLGLPDRTEAAPLAPLVAAETIVANRGSATDFCCGVRLS